MRIVLTVHQFFPDFRAGTEILTRDTAKALIARGHEVTVITGFPARAGLTDAQRFDRYRHDGIPVERFHHDHAPMGGVTNVAALEYDTPRFAAYFRDSLTRNKPDVAHFFHLQRLSASAIDACHDLNVPMVLTPTDFWPVCPTNQLLLPDASLCSGPDAAGVNCLRHVVARTQGGLATACLNALPDAIVATIIRAFDRGVLPRQRHASEVRALSVRRSFMRSRFQHIDRIAVPTRFMADMLGKNGFNAARMSWLPFGIGAVASPARAPARAGSALRVGYIGTLIEHKGAHVLVAAVRALAPAVPLEVTIYGNAEEFPNYTSRLREIAGSDSRIRFCGTFPDERISDIFATLDVLVVPSIWYENTPLVIYSAQACRCPVITSNLGGLAEVVTHEENGLLFEPGNATDLGRAMQRLAGDRALLSSLSERARQPKSSMEYATELESMYQEILSEGRAA